ncbi:Hpt domain-containing protein [Stieleria sp. JC731]|uniref:ATP-binding protein n=1 Tax=Pirellulaceae TaxID=2691357 RepID=UPI001E2F37A2|nr:ATP-binding protein [Stieleria sp. JC731]MCC9604008.1 Hpt domain-containing protein [Stieleria sp. JC731]
MFSSLARYIVLPAAVSDFENDYLARINRVFTIVLACHLPIFAAIAYFNDTDAIDAVVLTTAVLAGPLTALWTFKSRRAVSVVIGISAMFMGGLLVHFGQGPVQIEMHFYFFVLIALLAVFANPTVILAAATTAALHHLLLWYWLPSSVFNYDAPIWVVGVHAAFVVLESIAAVFIARSFFDNVIGLEKIVAMRTSELEARNDDMRMILNSVDQGFLTIDQHGSIQEERSKAVEVMLGEIKPGETLIDVIERHDRKAAEWLAFGLEEVFEGIMPVEVTLDQLPTRFENAASTFSIEYYPIEPTEPEHLTVVVTDITSEVERQKLEAESRELIRMLDGITKDRSGFLEFFHESSELIDGLRENQHVDLAVTKRKIHTLKGNAAIFGIERLADACHNIESALAESGEMSEGAIWSELFECWTHVRANLRRLISDTDDEYRLTDDQYNQLLLRILNREPAENLAPLVAAWKLEPTDVRLKRIATQAKRMAKQLEKGNIDVLVRSGSLRTEPKHWSPFWSALVHAIRNAVDHGLEQVEDRQLMGKSDFGTIILETAIKDERFVVSISDDGKGIDWDRVAKLAQDRALPFQTDDDLVNALFATGLSTSKTVTSISGRGIGMGALRQATESLGGSIEVESRKGEGTCYRFIFPADAMAPETCQLLASHGIDLDLLISAA